MTHTHAHLFLPASACSVDTKRIRTDEKCIYMCGQSLGLKPKNVNDYINDVLDTWGTSGVHSHFHGRLPCAYADALPKQPMAKLVGAFDTEVAVMNGLTVNLHLLLSTFYRPTAQRHRIIIEEHAFSSDMVGHSISNVNSFFIYSFLFRPACSTQSPLRSLSMVIVLKRVYFS